jgi:3'-5' exonuclease
MNVLTFDIETVPDVESARRLYDLPQDMNDECVANILFSKRRQASEGRSDFLPHHLQRVVAISAVLRRDERLRVWSLGDLDSPESEIIGRFFEGIEKYTPILVSWNGSGFDLPVLHYRALRHGIVAPRYWENGDDDQSFRWNNYLSRFHYRHTDLMDVLSGYQGRAVAPLDAVATMLGFPGKLGMDGSQVWTQYCAGNLKGIREYCETDALNTYLVYLRFEMMRGRLSDAAYGTECDRVRELLRGEDKPHFKAFES